jgi:hypothetical protein
MSIIRANQWQSTSGVPYNTVVNVVQTVYRDTFTTAIGDGYANVTGFSAAITPLSTSSRIVVNLTVHFGQAYWQFKGRLLRNGSVIDGALGNANGVRPRGTVGSINYDFGGPGPGQAIYDIGCLSAQYIDSPATTSTCTYQFQCGGYSTSFAVHVNRANAFSNVSSYDVLPISTLTLWELQS